MCDHLVPPAATPEPTAGIVKWLGSLFGGGGGAHADGNSNELEPVAVVAHADHPDQGVDTGHVHPSICKTADGTLIIVYAANENDSPGKDVLMCTRSTNGGESWSVASPIDCTRFSEKADAVADSATHEVYPGTLTTLPDDRVLCTWDYTYAKYPQQGRPLLYTLSATAGQTWGAQQLIFDPADPPDADLDLNQHLGTLRHSILVEDDGRWLLPLTVGGPRGSPTGAEIGTRSLCEWQGLEYPGVQLYDPDSGSLEPVPELSPGQAGSHPVLQYPILQVARSGGSGAMLAMGKGNSGHNQDPPELPSPAPVLFSVGKGQPWTEVHGFPANVECPAGVAEMDWDDDGDRWGRDLLALADGRFLVVWVVAGDRSQPSAGIHCCISEDGQTWDGSTTVILLPDTMVVGRYYQPKSVQLSNDHIGMVIMKGPQGAMDGIFYLKVPLSMLGSTSKSMSG